MSLWQQSTFILPTMTTSFKYPRYSGRGSDESRDSHSSPHCEKRAPFGVLRTYVITYPRCDASRLASHCSRYAVRWDDPVSPCWEINTCYEMFRLVGALGCSIISVFDIGEWTQTSGFSLRNIGISSVNHVWYCFKRARVVLFSIVLSDNIVISKWMGNIDRVMDRYSFVVSYPTFAIVNWSYGNVSTVKNKFVRKQYCQDTSLIIYNIASL